MGWVLNLQKEKAQPREVLLLQAMLTMLQHNLLQMLPLDAFVSKSQINPLPQEPNRLVLDQRTAARVVWV